MAFIQSPCIILGILNLDVSHLTRSLIAFEDVQAFISDQNAKLAIENRFLCANTSNAYNVMMVLLRRSLSLNQQVVTAHCSFKIGRFDEDCQFPEPLKIDWVYMAPILVIGILSVLNLTAVCFLACKIATKAPPVL